jgi:hypothetical protein
VAEIVQRCPAKQLMTLYKVAAFEGPEQFLQLVAQVRQLLGSTGSEYAPDGGLLSLAQNSWLIGLGLCWRVEWHSTWFVLDLSCRLVES